MNARALLVSVAALVVATPAVGQVWNTPSFHPPNPGDDIGIYVTDADGVDLGLQGIWRQQGNLNLGVRVGFLDTAGDGLLLVGVETWDGLFATADLPVDVSWTLGAGAAFNDGVQLGIPVGLSIGRTFDLDGLAFQVYGHPRLALVVETFGNDTDTDLNGLFDLGTDVYLGDSWKFRLGVTLGGNDALGAGLAYRFTRGVTVR